MALVVSTNISVRRTLLLVRFKRFYCNFIFKASWKVMPKIFFGNTFLTIYWEKYVDFHFSGIKKRSDFCCKQSVGGRVIYKEIWVPITIIKHTIFARSNTILSNQNTCSSSYSITEKGLVKILLVQDDRANKFCSIICVFARSYDRGSTL